MGGFGFAFRELAGAAADLLVQVAVACLQQRVRRDVVVGIEVVVSETPVNEQKIGW
jgi:hypothetical protein